MSHNEEIRFLQRKNIDSKKWDACIDNYSSNGLIYAHSFYLDVMSEQWSGLVLGDYSAVMPLTWNKKYGIHYLYQPFLCAQLGIFGENNSPTINERFFSSIPQQFRYIDIYLNSLNNIPDHFPGAYFRANYTLDLSKAYEDIYSNYRENIRRNIRKSQQLNCYSKKDFPVEDVLKIAREQMSRVAPVKNKDFDRAERLYHYLHRHDQAITYGIFSHAHQLLSSAIFFFSKNRAYYILVGNDPDGRTVGASHALVDAFIKDHAGKKIILDFEGSDIRNLAFFYSSFGATEEKYPALKINRLPFYLKWLKR